MKTNDFVSEAARLLGKIGGQSKSPRKKAAARENGKLGGRPKKDKKVLDKPKR
jgi:hypothetical protein